jgi:hypothetical protein
MVAADQPTCHDRIHSTHARYIVEIYKKRAFMTYAGVFIPFILRPQTLREVVEPLGIVF